ncbi:hypothetical protein [Burkholderia cenocepacia]|uniref:hypothetical protein n=1 Tax=Burkholderia cenocepacia TaxID=95486 RepID=UPI0021AB5965|nr:hypothetical protein [Burkholderia cenocepacia]
MDLTATASSLGQFESDGSILRGAAILSTRYAREVEEWTLDPLNEIRVGVTEFCEQTKQLMKVTQFTMSDGRRFSVPYAMAIRTARGRRLWSAQASKSSANI